MRKRFLLLWALFLLLILPAAVRAADAPEKEPLRIGEADWMYPDGDGEVRLMSDETDATERLCALLREAAEKRTEEVNVSAFGIPVSMVGDVVGDCLNRMPELYDLSHSFNYSYVSLSGPVEAIFLRYLEMEPEADEALEAAVEEALSCVLPGMDDVQKALVLHDWLVRNVTYDDTRQSSERIYSAYGALAERLAVCEGYARAYQLLLGRCGIESVFLSSKEMNHAWNAVKLGGQWYHADVTWDDGGIADAVLHDYFLCSDSAFAAKGHGGWRMLVTCGDTAFDNAFWSGVNSEICFLDAAEAWYLTAAFDERTFKMHIALMKRDWESGETSELSAADDLWYVWNDEMRIYSNICPALCAWYGKLYYHDSLHITCYDPAADTAETVFTYDGGEGYLYGLSAQGDRLLYRLSKSPNEAGILADSGLVPVIPPICTYDPETRSVFVNRVFADGDTLCCAGYDEDGRLCFVCFLVPEEETVLPEAAAVRLFRLGSGFAPKAEAAELTA